MAGRGAIPKTSRVRDADNVRRQVEFTTLRADGEVRGPELPDGVDWPEQTQAMYDAIRRDAIAQALTAADWLHVIDTMSLHRLLWTDEPGNALKVAAEVRLRLAQLGVTPESRLRLRMLIAPEADEKPESKLEGLRRREQARRRRLIKVLDEQ